MKTGKIAVMTGPNRPFEVKEFPLLPVPEGMARMKLLASGVCGTDLHIMRGKLSVDLPACIGHEFIGKVEDIHEADSARYGISPGDNVIVDIAVPCGECVLCKEGNDANCVNMGVTNGERPDVAPHFFGGFSEYNYTSVRNLVKIPDGLDPLMVGVFACPGPTTIHAVRLGREAGLDFSRVNVAVVQGAGPVGCFAAAYIAAQGVKEVLVVGGKAGDRRSVLVKQLGATEVFDHGAQSMDEVVKYVQSKNGGLGADLVFEASGNPGAVPQGMDMLRNRGMYLVPGQYSESGGVEIQPQIITFKALSIIGSSQYSMVDVRDYVEFLSEHPEIHETVKALATCYRVEDVNKAFEDACAKKNIKTVIVP